MTDETHWNYVEYQEGYESESYIVVFYREWQTHVYGEIRTNGIVLDLNIDYHNLNLERFGPSFKDIADSIVRFKVAEIEMRYKISKYKRG